MRAYRRSRIMGSYEEIQAKMDQVELGDDESVINPDVQQIMDLIQDPVDVPTEPEERWGYVDLARLWQAYCETGREDLSQLIGEVITGARWGLSASVPEELQNRVNAVLAHFERTELVAALIRCLKSNADEEKVGEAYRNLYRTCGYDDVAVARAIYTQTQGR
jgi:hypothetical protein